MPINNIIQVGASGSLGTPVLNALLASGRFNVSVLTRPSSKSAFPSGAIVVKADYDSHESLVAALKGQDAAVVTLGGSNEQVAVLQTAVLNAAIEAGVGYFIPSDFTADITTEPGLSQAIFAPKVRAEVYLQKVAAEGKIKYTSVHNGAFLEWGLQFGSVGIDLVNRKAELIDGGTRKVIYTTLSSIADVVVSILSNPEPVQNRAVRIHDFYISQREILAIAEQELGATFPVADVAAAELIREFEPQLANWANGAPALIRASAWGENSSAAWGVDDDSKLLGLKSKNLREEVVKVIHQLNLH